MKDCDAIRDRIDAILDDSRGSDMPDDIRDHVNTCDDCARHLRRQRRLIETLESSSPVPQIPPFFEKRIIDRLPASPIPKPAVVRRVWFRITATAAIAVIALGLYRRFKTELPLECAPYQYTAEELRMVETLIADIFPPNTLTNATESLLSLKNPLDVEYTALVQDVQPVGQLLDALFPEALQAD